MSRRASGGVRAVAEAISLYLLVGVVGYLSLLFVVNAVVFPGMNLFRAEGVPTHVAYGPFVLAAGLLLLTRVRRLRKSDALARIRARIADGRPDQVELELCFWSGEGSYRETVRRGEYQAALESLQQIATLGHGVARVVVDDRVAAAVGRNRVISVEIA